MKLLPQTHTAVQTTHFRQRHRHPPSFTNPTPDLPPSPTLHQPPNRSQPPFSSSSNRFSRTRSDPEHREEEEAPVVGDDEDTGAQVAPIVKLEEVVVTTGDQNEDAILDLKSKLYRFDKDGNQWKERGVDTVKFLKHKATGKKDNEGERGRKLWFSCFFCNRVVRRGKGVAM
ncbi:hypothetical protein KIW84_075185 [Lathyrus oleraceus]|uniref:RanBD1 domain-containing protein n=1 Tax=Pisum sativum TaxID=3888 RepID=A0A9D5A0S3_PEA|nr:hypothetical protein KIW84_075185 [Pisum sativum]